MHTSTNEAGTPVYSVTVEESRRVTMSRNFTILGGTPEAAKTEAEERAARGWTAVAELGGFSLGPVEKSGELDLDGDAARRLLERCESFIAGFEDDDDQEGVPELLAELRAQIAAAA